MAMLFPWSQATAGVRDGRIFWNTDRSNIHHDVRCNICSNPYWPFKALRHTFRDTALICKWDLCDVCRLSDHMLQSICAKLPTQTRDGTHLLSDCDSQLSDQSVLHAQADGFHVDSKIQAKTVQKSAVRPTRCKNGLSHSNHHVQTSYQNFKHRVSRGRLSTYCCWLTFAFLAGII